MNVIVPCCNKDKMHLIKLPNKMPLPVFGTSGIKSASNIFYAFNEQDFFGNYTEDSLFWRGGICLLKRKAVNQVEAVRKTIQQNHLFAKQIYIKECTGYFESVALPDTITVNNIRFAKYGLRNKSYALFDDENRAIEVSANEPIGQYICAGGYGFNKGDEFLKYSEGCTSIIEVIINAIKNNKLFYVNKCKNYIDYSDLISYNNFLKGHFSKRYL